MLSEWAPLPRASRLPERPWARVAATDLKRPLEEETVPTLVGALREHEVPFFPEQKLNDAERVRLGRHFSLQECHPALDRVESFP